MIKLNTKNRHTIRRRISLAILLVFVVHMGFSPISPAFGQTALPLPGTMVNLSSAYAPALIKGLRVYPDNPLRFDFIVDAGDSALQGEEFKQESSKLIKYFLSSLTIPDKDLWVNLSPYEKDRIIPDAFGKTEMGRDLLAQDYILKQLSASIIYPESKLGQSFWAEVYRRANEVMGSSANTVETFNKIWVVPQKAVVFAKDNTAYIVESHLKVMMEEDFLSLAKSTGQTAVKKNSFAQSVSSKIFRDLVLPQIEKEVNEGENFAPLRQVYHSLMLAAWFKRNLRNNILGKVYVGQNKTDGVMFNDNTDKERIYSQYVQAFQKGVYNFIKEEKDKVTDEVIPRKYFSGGVSAFETEKVLEENTDGSRVAGSPLTASAAVVAVELGKPGASSTVLADNPDAVALSERSERFSVRDNYRFGPKVVVATMDVNLTPSKKYQFTKDINTTDQTSRNDAIAAFRAAFASSDRDPVESLKAIRPLVDYILARYARERGFRNAVGDELAGNFEYLKNMLNGIGDFDTVYTQNVLALTLDVIGRLPDEAIGQIIDAARKNSERFIQVTYGGLENLDNFKIALTVNADDVFRFRDEGSARYVLEIDVLSFLGDYFTRSIQLAWRHYTPTDLSREQLRKKVLQLAQQHKNDFIQSNVEVVEEVLMIMQYMQDWDNYFGIGRYLYTDRSEQQAAFLADIAADERNRQLVRLIRQLGDLYIEEQQGEKTVRLPDTQRRAEAILRFILNKTRLARRASIQGQYTQADVALIAELSNNLFILSTKEFSEKEIRGSNTVDRQETPPVKVVNQQVYERSLLELRAAHTGDAKVPEAVLASGVDESAGSAYTATEYVSRQREYEQRTVVIPFDRNDARYLPDIAKGVDQMKSATSDGQRARIFFSTVWPKYLVSVAESWSSESIDQQMQQGIDLLDTSLQKLLKDLIHLSKNAEIQSGDVEPIAQSLRTNKFLTDNQIFVQTEVVTRNDSLGKTRSLLTMISFNIDEILERQVDGVNVPIRYLGDRLDLLDKDVKALGFMYLGDGHGVVLKQMVRNDTILSLLPELRQAPFQILDGETLHPIYPLMRQAIARDYTFNPSSQQQEDLYSRRYRSTARHEGQHVADDKNGVQNQYSGIEKRVAQEMTAYLASIADEDADGTPNMPFTDLVKVGRLYISLSSGFGALSDMFGIYRDATAHILLLFARQFNIEMTIDDLRNAPKTSIAKILEQALELDRVQLKNAAKSILKQEKQDQENHKSYLFPVKNREHVHSRVPARRVFVSAQRDDTWRKRNPNKPSSAVPGESGQMTIDSQDDYRWPLGFLSISMSVPRWAMAGAAALALWGVPNFLAQEDNINRRIEAGTQGVAVDPNNPDNSTRTQQPVFSLPGLKDTVPSLILSTRNAGHVVLPGQTLSEIAGAYYGPSSAFRGAIQIYNENVNNLRSIDDIPAGVTLIIPDAAIRLHDVLPGDTLSSIAYRYYGDSSQWRRIAYINRDPLAARGLKPLMTLLIPMSQMEANNYERSKPPAPDYSISKDSASSSVGGISLERIDEQLQMQGEAITFDVPPIDPQLLKNLQAAPVNGFVPVILEVVPINAQTLPIFLGQVSKEPAREPEMGSLTEG